MTFSIKDPFLISYAFTHVSGPDSGFIASSARPSHNKSFGSNERKRNFEPKYLKDKLKYLITHFLVSPGPTE